MRKESMSKAFDSFRIEHVYREQNREADALANEALDETEGIESLGHFQCALEQRAQVLALHFVQPAHLFDQQLGIALNAQRANAMRLCVVHRRDQAVIFGDIIGHAADVFFQLGDDFAPSIANDYAVSGRPGIAARAAVNVRAMRRRGRLGLRRSIAEQIFSTGSWRSARHQEFVEATEVEFAEPAAEFATGIGSSV